MRLMEISDRLQWARKNHGRYKKATEAARAFGWKVSTYLGHENGDRSPSRETAKKYAKAYRVRWEWLLEGEGKPTTGEKNRATQVVGYVGAGTAEILPFDVDDPSSGSFDEVEALPGVPEDAALVIVRGNSMYPRYFENEMLLYVRRMDDPREHVGKECVVALTDGRMLVKMLRRANGGLFNLESWNAPPIEAVAIQWAAPVLARVNRSGR
jgi:phage repressor protein C with HTH and peptisase S24 domain